MTAPAAPAVAHEAAVAVLVGRYPYRPVCSCGWIGPVGYVARHAALTMAEDHAEGGDDA